MSYPKFNLTHYTASVLAGAVALCLFSCGYSTEAGSVPAIDPEKVRVARKLIEGLNSDHYLIREKARASLPRLGRSAIEPLEAATHSEASEIRLRATELLIALRGRGLLGIGMLQPPLDALPEFGAGVKSVLQDMPAEKAGLQSGDVIVELNGEPVDDNNMLQYRVFSAGPARVMEVVALRGEERMRFQIMLTLNLNNLNVVQQTPPVDLERELPASDDPKGREQARVRAVNQFNGGFVQAIPDTLAPPPPPPEAPVNVKELETEFDSLKVQVEKEQAEEKGSNTAAK